MFLSEPTPAGRPTRLIVLAVLVVVGAAVVGIVGFPTLAASSSPALPPITMRSLEHRSHDTLPRSSDGHLGKADGVVPDDVTVFDDGYPAVAELDPALLSALRNAATSAADDRVELLVNSGWRSRRYQERLFAQAVSTYGSAAKAARWVAAPGTSAHESGDAVDIGHSDAATWLSRHGSRYGLCQTYGDEPWHFELRPDAVDHGCPRMYADPTHDPRMQEES
ncbi:MAG: hypothetical protein JWO46_858 [Nocardioidaceae bacterium]|nr:hypothetical protein [Nocardioidaceae bacterium]